MSITYKFIFKTNKKYIENYMRNNKMNVSSFCKACDISLKDYQDLMSNNPDIDTNTFCKIIINTKIQLKDLLE